MSNKATQFKKGYDARRFVPVNAGLVAYHAKLGDLHRAQSLDAANYVYEVMMDKASHPKLRLTAAQEIMNRAAGKPVDVAVIVAIGSGNSEDITKYSNAELAQMIAKLTKDSDIIEGEFIEGPVDKG